MKKKMQLRSSRGAAMIALVLALFLFTALAGFFAFDASRAEMAKRELVAACDAASLAGTAMLATYDTSPDNPTAITLTLAQQNSAAYGLNMFQKGSLLGRSLLMANYVSSPAALGTATGGQCNVLVALTDPNNSYNGVAPGDPKGKAISVFAAYGYMPAFLPGFFGHIGSNYILNASSTGGLPQVDAVMVFDFSGSMDDFTKVTFIRRSWDGPAMKSGTHANRVRYLGIVPPTSSTTLSDYIAWNYDPGSGGDPAGTPVNVLPPQNLASAGGNPLPVPPPMPPAVPITFDLYTRQAFDNASLTPPSINDYAAPPGDCTLPVKFGGYIMNPVPLSSAINGYMGGPVPPASGPHQDLLNRWVGWIPGSPLPANAKKSLGLNLGLLPTPPGLDNTYYDEPMRPYLWRYDSSYNAHTAVPAPSGTGVVTNYFNGPGAAGAWVTEDCQGLDVQGGIGHGRYTDLVVNLAPPGSPMIQPISCPDTFPGGVATYGGMSYSFDATETDPRLVGQTFDFPNMATIVEASRGNLDSVGSFQAALPSPFDATKFGTVIDFGATNMLGAAGLGSTVVLATPTGQPYQLAYQRLAMLESQPYATAVDGAVNGFFYKLNGLADCRFGLVGFSTSTKPAGAGNDAGIIAAGPNLNTIGTYDINSYYVTYVDNAPHASPFNNAESWQSFTGTNYGGVSATAKAYNVNTVNGDAATMQGFRVPRSPLDANHNDINECCSMPNTGVTPWDCPDGSPAGKIWSDMSGGGNGLWNGRPMNDTNMAEALTTGLAMFNNAGAPGYTPAARPASRKAIVFFTDGEPTGGIAGADATATTAQAVLAKSQGIAVFTIGLNMNGNVQLTTDQQTFLGDNIAPNGPGLAYKAGNGGNFFMCSDAKSVRQAFINVARRLSQNQQ